MSASAAESSASVPSFRRERVANGVTTYLRDLILTGQLRAGEHLRVEQLASRLDISVTPIRESLLELFTEGYVEREPHRGYVVAEITRAGFEDEVLVLAMITGELTARAVDNASEEDIAELTEIQRRIQAADRRKDLAAAEDLNHEFHSAINKLAASPRLAWLAQRHSHYVPRTTFESLDARPSVCTHDHRKILAAMRARDREAARKAMTDHLIESGKSLADILDSGGFWP
jgi:DNA-binding GntR family transcriptional regulator